MFIGPSFWLSELLTENVLRFSLIMNVCYVSLDACMVQTRMILVIVLGSKVLINILLLDGINVWNEPLKSHNVLCPILLLDISSPLLLLLEYKGLPNGFRSIVGLAMDYVHRNKPQSIVVNQTILNQKLSSFQSPSC